MDKVISFVRDMEGQQKKAAMYLLREIGKLKLDPDTLNAILVEMFQEEYKERLERTLLAIYTSTGITKKGCVWSIFNFFSGVLVERAKWKERLH